MSDIKYDVIMRLLFMDRIGFLFLFVSLFLFSCESSQKRMNRSSDFTFDWKFYLGDIEEAKEKDFNDANWRLLNLPHDWAIEGDFNVDNPSGAVGGALPGGIGWYRKTFTLSKEFKSKKVFIDFDGVYMNSEVFLNGISLGKRPYGYISFRYDLTPYLKFGEPNVLAVRVNNSKQPNSRWYSGCGIYRNVWLVVLDPIHVDNWGTYVTTPYISTDSTVVSVKTTVKNDGEEDCEVEVSSTLIDAYSRPVEQTVSKIQVTVNDTTVCDQNIVFTNPQFWTLENPYLYQIKTELIVNGELSDTYYTTIGIRSFYFDSNKGFFLNGKQTKINGVCLHHDLGCLGSAINKRAIERQLEILKRMGCNGIRCSHNPPAPELLDLCDRMGFIVMNEAFDMWCKGKTQYDYALFFNEWHERDLEDLLLRDRNHPSIFMWSIGNEVLEQWTHPNCDTLSAEQANIALNLGFGKEQLAKEEKLSVNSLLCKKLVNRVKTLDPIRPVTAACHEPSPNNHLFRSNALDIIGYNYHHQDYANVLEKFPEKPFLATETVSGLMTRGYYRMPSDKQYVWPLLNPKTIERDKEDYTSANYSCSSYDNCFVPWGTCHENSLRIMKNNDFISGQYVWTGFDYLGEPTPFSFPARSSYFGIVDLAGFPKDIYYMYQSEWTNQKVLHLFPHWNWEKGQDVDMWVYYNQADEVELFVNGVSQGVKSKKKDELHVTWKVKFELGTVKVVSRKAGKVILEKKIHTAGMPVQIRLTPDRSNIFADGKDLSFVTVEVLDKDGNLCPNADNLINFNVSGKATIVGVDNGNPTSMERFKDNKRKAFYGKCLIVLQNNGAIGEATLTATSTNLVTAVLKIHCDK